MTDMKRDKLVCRCALLAVLAATEAAAGNPEWQDNSLTLVAGGHFRVDPETRLTLTYEHASGWGFGDLFMFVDATRFNEGRGNAYYGELSPRFSYAKLSGTGMGAGRVRDVLLATTLEFGEGDVETLLAGPGFDLAVPGLDFFQLNLYHRFPLHGQDGRTIQVTPVWAVTRGRWRFDGFIDWNIHSDGAYASNWHVNPQLKYDLGKSFGWPDRAVQVGVEYSHWKNKYGIRDSSAFRTDENALSVIVQSHF
ncbi:MAG: outer membrane protein OmpK [Gallionellaceae bacterium]|nr:outer membrane protein OmpK [Gallionellaceae bacterium]